MKLILRWAINALAVWVAAIFVEGVRLEGDWFDFLLIGIVMGLVNAIIKPILQAAGAADHHFDPGTFHIRHQRGHVRACRLAHAARLSWTAFMAALLGSILISIVSTVLNWFVGD